MPKQLVGEHIAKARAILELNPIPTHHHDNLQATLCDLELHLQAHEKADYTRLANLLSEVEAELEVEHAIVSSVIGSIVRILANMGI